MGAVRAVCSSVIMLCFLVYIFSLGLYCIVPVDDPDLKEGFKSLPKILWMLFMAATGMEGAGPTLRHLMEVGAFLPVMMFLGFIMLTSMTVMNMLVGVLCAVVADMAQAEKDNRAASQLKNTLLVMLLALDSDGSGNLEKEEINEIFRYEEVVQVLSDLGINLSTLISMMDMLFDSRSDETVPVGFLMDLTLRCRGDRPVTVQDLIDRQSHIVWELSALLKDVTKSIDGRITKMMTGLSAVHKQTLCNQNQPSIVEASPVRRVSEESTPGNHPPERTQGQAVRES